MLRSRRGSGEHDFFVQFEAIAERRFPLTLKEASINADEENQTYEVTFTMPRVENYTILPGMSALVIAETASGGEDANSRFHLPAAAVLEDREGRFVYLVKADSGKDGPTQGVGVIERRPVTTGELDARGLLVTSGLKRGEHVLTAGMSQAQPGMKVRWNQGG